MFVKGIGYCIASIWLLQLAATNATPATEERIVGGQITTIDHFPFLVQIWIKGQFICGGSLLTPQVVASAAHCVDTVHAANLIVVAGATKLGEPGVSRRVAHINVLPNYTSRTMDNDVSVLKLMNSFPLGKNIGVIKLYAGGLKAGMKVDVSGWGLTSENAISPSKQLRTITVPITERATCVNQYRGVATLTKNMFCASLPGTKDACSGDSGGPATIDGKLAGIVSFGKGCARKQNSGIYTDVQQVKHLIEMWLKS